MLRLSRFSYLKPSSLDEAASLLAEKRDDAVLMAGGTDLLVNIKHRLVTPAFVIAIGRLPELLEYRVDGDGWLTLGAGISLHDLETDPSIRHQYPALATAAASISVPQIRAVGTIGGNICLDVRCNYYNQSYEWRKGIGFCMKKDSPICRVAPGGDRCWAVSSADTVPVLIALRAEVSIAGPSGSRRVPIEALYCDDGLEPIALSPTEIVAAVHLPPPGDWRCTYEKFRIRQSFDFPLVSVAVAVHTAPDSTVLDARIVTTAVSSQPERITAAESALIGSPLTPASIEAAASAVYKISRPMDNTAGTIFHRKRMSRVLSKRALESI